MWGVGPPHNARAAEAEPEMAAQNGADSDQVPMLGRSVTFARAVKTPAAYEATASSFLTKLVGSKAGPVSRVSESLDYEPIQNKLFYDRMKTRKEGKKKLYGWVGLSWRRGACVCVGGGDEGD